MQFTEFLIEFDDGRNVSGVREIAGVNEHVAIRNVGQKVGQLVVRIADAHEADFVRMDRGVEPQLDILLKNR